MKPSAATFLLAAAFFVAAPAYAAGPICEVENEIFTRTLKNINGKFALFGEWAAMDANKVPHTAASNFLFKATMRDTALAIAGLTQKLADFPQCFDASQRASVTEQMRSFYRDVERAGLLKDDWDK